jgi:hypothetical protein
MGIGWGDCKSVRSADDYPFDVPHLVPVATFYLKRPPCFLWLVEPLHT